MLENPSNWAGNYTYHAARLHFPETMDQLRRLVSRASKVKVLGSRHSFNSIADTPGDLISLERMEPVTLIDRERSTVTVNASATYGRLSAHLQREGYALPNLASLPHISVAGACATATHGSGNSNGNLATAVSGIELVTADGSLITLSRDRQQEGQFAGAVVHLGGLGVVTSLTLDIVPPFDMQQHVYENLPLAELELHFDAITSAGDSVSLFTDWTGERVNYVWLKRRVDGDVPFEPQPELFGAPLARVPRHPIPGLPPEVCTEQLGVVGPWHERLPHFRMGFTPSSGEELQFEYLVPRGQAVAALRAIHSLRGRVSPLVQISEIRTIAADDLWMSPCYGQPCVAVHFTWKKQPDAVMKVLPLIEERLAPLGARPHWGKLFAMSPVRLQSLFPRLPDFQQLLKAYDPAGKFRNDFLDTYIFR